VELGALVVTQDRKTNQIANSSWPVLGKTVLDRWVERVQGLGIDLLSVIDRDSSPNSRIPTMVDWAKGGVERILLILLGSYAEVDLMDVVRFHHQGQNRITRVFDPVGPLGISLLNRDTVLKNDRIDLCAFNKSTRYDFLGYAVRLSSPSAYRKLVEDALEGKCAVQPNGLDAGDCVWTHPAAHIDPSVRLEGPCYVGAYARLHPGVVIGSGSSVEHNCEIDIGTTLEHASVLPDTYLAPGLCVRNSIVDGARLEHLERRVSVDLAPLGLSARRKRISKQMPKSTVLGFNGTRREQITVRVPAGPGSAASASSETEATGR
jgi:hypothetical protein